MGLAVSITAGVLHLCIYQSLAASQVPGVVAIGRCEVELLQSLDDCICAKFQLLLCLDETLPVGSQVEKGVDDHLKVELHPHGGQHQAGVHQN